uniref:Uncharacterized protein n=1 Tax=viral metagenome TaxID=1070528 RepID=A0A6M3LXM1_9ZZZZ
MVEGETHVPGDAHSKCCHPYNKPLLDNPMLQMMGIFASVGRVGLPPMADKRLKIQANAHGVNSGWFHYPFNFDPVWLDACSGFEAIKENDPRVLNKHRAKDSYKDAKTCEQPTFCEDCEIRFKCFTERENGIYNDI